MAALALRELRREDLHLRTKVRLIRVRDGLLGELLHTILYLESVAQMQARYRLPINRRLIVWHLFDRQPVLQQLGSIVLLVI